MWEMFKRDASFEKHLKKHIKLGDVDWSCTGDGIREPLSITVTATGSPKQSDNANRLEVQIQSAAEEQNDKSQKQTKNSTN